MATHCRGTPAVRLLYACCTPAVKHLQEAFTLQAAPPPTDPATADAYAYGMSSSAPPHPHTPASLASSGAPGAHTHIPRAAGSFSAAAAGPSFSGIGAAASWDRSGLGSAGSATGAGAGSANNGGLAPSTQAGGYRGGPLVEVRLAGSVADHLRARGASWLLTRRLRDIHLYHPELTVDLEVLAYSLYCHESSGANMSVQVRMQVSGSVRHAVRCSRKPQAVRRAVRAAAAAGWGCAGPRVSSLLCPAGLEDRLGWLCLSSLVHKSMHDLGLCPRHSLHSIPRTIPPPLQPPRPWYCAH